MARALPHHGCHLTGRDPYRTPQRLLLLKQPIEEKKDAHAEQTRDDIRLRLLRYHPTRRCSHFQHLFWIAVVRVIAKIGGGRG